MRTDYKRSILGLNTVKAFIVVMLALAIIGIVTLIVLGVLGDVGVFQSESGSVNNEGKAYLNNTGYTLAEAGQGRSNFVPTITNITNATNGITIAVGNYTLTGNVLTNASSTAWEEVNVSYTFTYNSQLEDGVIGITNNVSEGIATFFSNSITYFALLGVVVIILIISLVVVVVNRFGGGSGESQGPSL